MRHRRVIAGAIAAILGISVVLAAISPFLSGDDGDAASTPTAPAVALLPDVTVSDLAGQPVSLRSLAGRPMVVNYWYSTCPPCMAEMPALASVAAEYGDRVRFVGINPQDTAERAASFAADRGVGYEQYLDRTGASVDALRLTGFPSTVLVDASGRVVLVHRNEVTADELRDLIDDALLETS